MLEKGGGGQPLNTRTKTRCLTAWPHPARLVLIMEWRGFKNLEASHFFNLK
jgi:hypothetical protein